MFPVLIREQGNNAPTDPKDYLNAGDVGALLCTATEIVRRVIRLPPFRNIELAAYRGGVKTNSRTLAPEGEGATRVKFHHTGWPEENEHWRVSCFCWARYLRIRRNVEYGETVEYERHLEV